MKNYKSYLDRQEISQAAHENLLNLEVGKRSARPWVKYGALAACAALIIGVGAWRLAPAPAANPVQSDNQFAADHTPLPGDTDVAEPGGSFVVKNRTFVELNSPTIPGLLYQDITDRPEAAACRAYNPGSFMVDLTKEDIQAIFWGPESVPEGGDDLPCTLFWSGYTVRGCALYDGQGQLMELTIWGENGRADFELELRLGGLPITCCIDMDRGDKVSEFNGVQVAGWSKVFGRNGDHYICGSEFMTKNDIGVRFVNRNSSVQSEHVPGEDTDLERAQTFNALFVLQALTEDGGLHLDHLKTVEHVPAWREESFSTLAQARQEADFAPYLPTAEPKGYNEFYGRLSYQEGHSNSLFVRWSRAGAYDDVEVAVYRDGYYSYNLVSPDQPETYDLSLYPIPWCDSVPEKYRETVDRPAFKAEDMSLAIVEARGREHDTGGMTYSFDVLHPDGTVVSYRCDGLTAAQVWAMVEETLR